MSIPGIVVQAVKIWEEAQVVYEEPSREGVPKARVLVEKIASLPDLEEDLVELLSHPKVLVVAYALKTLALMQSRALAKLPDGLLERRGKVALQTGSFRNSMDLGGLARQLQSQARRQTGEIT